MGVIGCSVRLARTGRPQGAVQSSTSIRTVPRSEYVSVERPMRSRPGASSSARGYSLSTHSRRTPSWYSAKFTALCSSGRPPRRAATE